MEISTKTRKRIKEKGMVKRDSIGAELHHLDEDKSITTDDPAEKSKRRTLKLTKKENTWGFTLQTYGIKHKRTNEIEVLTYVDYIEISSPAWYAGLRKGDVILSVNGERVGDVTHQQLVDTIKKAGNTIRLVVLFEDCCRKVELHEKYMKLKAVLRSKYEELRELERQENQIIQNYCQEKGLNRFDMVRQSVMSNFSSSSESWDAYSTISSPTAVLPTGHFAHKNWSSVISLKSYSMGDNLSMLDDNYSFIDSESESDGITVNFRNQVNMRGSDSNLVSKFAQDQRMLRLRDRGCKLPGSSDSQLYRRSWSPMQGQKIMKSPLIRSDDSALDDVFTEQELAESATFPKRRQTMNHQRSKVFYAGENGNIIVPKICIEGNAVFTTFEEIDTQITDTPKIDPETYQDKVVAIEIANEMARIEKLEKEKTLTKARHVKPDMFSRSLEPSFDARYGRHSAKGERSVKQAHRDHSKLSLNLESAINSSKEDTEVKTPEASSSGERKPNNGARSKYSATVGSDGSPGKTDIWKFPIMSSPKSPRNIGGSMSYEQLKSSVPDIRVSFHTDECQVIYINDKDETTRL